MKSPNRNKFKRWLHYPGVWEDMDGAAHLNIVAMLRQAGYPENEITPQVIKEAGEMALALVARLAPNIKHIYRQSEED